jgi:homeobox protein cut-like
MEIEKSIEYWANLDLSSRRLQLDAQCLEVGNLADAADESRKALGEKVVAFKRAPNDETRLATFQPLLKAMQEEIDMLTKRARFSEKNFLKLAGDLSG